MRRRRRHTQGERGGLHARLKAHTSRPPLWLWRTNRTSYEPGRHRRGKCKSAARTCAVTPDFGLTSQAPPFTWRHTRCTEETRLEPPGKQQGEACAFWLATCGVQTYRLFARPTAWTAKLPSLLSIAGIRVRFWPPVTSVHVPTAQLLSPTSRTSSAVWRRLTPMPLFSLPPVSTSAVYTLRSPKADDVLTSAPVARTF